MARDITQVVINLPVEVSYYDDNLHNAFEAESSQAMLEGIASEIFNPEQIDSIAGLVYDFFIRPKGLRLTVHHRHYNQDYAVWRGYLPRFYGRGIIRFEDIPKPPQSCQVLAELDWYSGHKYDLPSSQYHPKKLFHVQSQDPDDFIKWQDFATWIKEAK